MAQALGLLVLIGLLVLAMLLIMAILRRLDAWRTKR